MLTPSLFAILAIIMFERFAWYEMLGGLTLWQGADVTGNLLLGSYLISFVGGLVAHRFSLRVVSLLGLVVFILGYSTATLSNHTSIALWSWMIACGLFKPCFGSLLGSLYDPGKARTKAFSIYYGAIQIGSMPSTLVGGYLRAHWGWPAVYACCAIAVALAAVTLLAFWRYLAPRLPTVSEDRLVAEALTSAPVEFRPQWGRIGVLLVGGILFWAGWKQQSTTLVYWASDVCGVDVPEIISTCNPVFAAFFLFLTPIGSWENARLRASVALLSMTVGFALLYFHSSLAYLIIWYGLSAFAEILISPLGMDAVTALVPERYSALAMAAWLSTMGLGGKLAGVIASHYRGDLRQAVLVSACFSAVGALWYATLLRERTSRSSHVVQLALSSDPVAQAPSV